MAVEKRYPLPENPNPDNDRCFIVYYPDALEYRLALLGSLTFLGTWTAWQKDASHSALIASQRWKRANLRTLDANRNVDCELIDALTEDDDMAININNNVECGGCGCNGATDAFCISPTNPPRPENWPTEEEVPDFEPTEFEDTGDNVPDGATDRAEYDDFKCRAARKLAIDFQSTILALETLGGIAAVFGALAFSGSAATPYVVGAITAVAGIFGIAISLPGIMALFLAAVAALVIVGISVFAYFSLVAAELDLDQLTCDLFLSRTNEEAKSAFVFHTNLAVTTLAIESQEHGNLFITVLLKIVDYFTPDEVLSVLFKVTSWHRENLLEPFNCSLCEGSPTGLFFRGFGWTSPGEVGNLNEEPVSYYQTYQVYGDSAGRIDLRLAVSPTGFEVLENALIQIVGFTGNDETGRAAGDHAWYITDEDGLDVAQFHTYDDMPALPFTALGARIRGSFYDTFADPGGFVQFRILPNV